jgi:hypothetical protein
MLRGICSEKGPLEVGGAVPQTALIWSLACGYVSGLPNFAPYSPEDRSGWHERTSCCPSRRCTRRFTVPAQRARHDLRIRDAAPSALLSASTRSS